MRANAPFPVLLAIAGVVLAAAAMLPGSALGSVPGSVSGRPRKPAHAGQHVLHPGNPHLSKHGGVQSKVRKAGRHERRVSSVSPKRHRGKRAVSADKPSRDSAAVRRVHAWEQSHKADPAGTRPDAAAAGTALDAAPDRAETAADAAKPQSVVSTIRTAGNATERPRLPPVEELVAEPVILPALYNKRGRLVVPPALKGSHEILVHQNVMADSDGLERVRDEEDLLRMRNTGMLVAIPGDSRTLRTDERLPANRRYVRPWTALFLDTLARHHYAHFQTALQVNSAVRTVEFQQRLIHTNGNAAPAEGDTASPHLTGQAVDIAKRGLSMAEIAWLRGYLLPLVQQGKVDVEEEFQQSCFHISVYRNYMPQAPANRGMIATTHREGMTALGTMLR